MAEVQKSCVLVGEVKEEIFKECERRGSEWISSDTVFVGMRKKRLIKAFWLLTRAKKYNKNVRRLAKRLYRDIEGIRRAKETALRGFLTKEEAFVLANCNNLNHLLDKARAITKQAISEIDSVKAEYVYKSIGHAFEAILEIVRILRRLFHMETQVKFDKKNL